MDRSLLLVDDEPSILRALKRIFHRAGYKVSIANGPEEALEILKDKAFPVVLSDYRMPNKNGGELLIEIKEKYPSTLGLILSGYADLQSVIAALNSGAVYKFLEKPWEETQLLEEMDQAFEHWRQEYACHINDAGTISASITMNDQGVITDLGEGVDLFFKDKASTLVGLALESALPLLSANDVKSLALSGGVELELPDTKYDRVLHVCSRPATDQRWEVSLSFVKLGDVDKAEADLAPAKLSLMDNIEGKILTHSGFSLIYLDIRHFRHFNDCLGYQKSDHLLHHLYALFQVNVSDEIEFSLMNGAAFVFFVPEKFTEQTALTFISSLLSPFKQLINFDDRELMLTFSAGYSVYPEDGDSAEALIRSAQLAANYSKDRGLDIYPRYSPSMDKNRDDMVSLQSELCHALKRNEFSLFYQPKISLVTGEILGAEALIRWRHAEKGMISPDRFIPLAELTGLIEPIGEWVLSTAIAQCYAWQAEGLPPFIMSVNVSGRQLVENGLADKVKTIIEGSGLSSEFIELEVTETFLMQDIEHSIDVLKQIKALGVKIAIDDFGTGYSSLNYLTRLPVDTLKVDRSFVMELSERAEKANLVKNMIIMSHDLGMRVVAEGVETVEQLKQLQEMGCDEVQGFYFSRPVVADEFKALLKAKSWVYPTALS